MRGPGAGNGDNRLRERAKVYGFFALVFAREPDADTMEALRADGALAAWKELDDGFAEPSRVGDPQRVAEDLACEFARLFLGPQPVVPPYQSCHDDSGREDSRRLWSDATSRVYRTVRDLGLEFGEAYHGIPDHISLVLEMMQRFLDEEAGAFERGDRSTAVSIRNVRLRFFEDHVGAWGERFFSRVEEESRNVFYRSLGKLGRRFLAVEAG